MKSERFATPLISVLAPPLLGYAALLVGSYAALALVRVGQQPLAVALFVLALFPGSFRLFLSALGMGLTTEKGRFTQFAIAFAMYAGIFGGSAWVLWFHGDPARIVP